MKQHLFVMMAESHAEVVINHNENWQGSDRRSVRWTRIDNTYCISTYTKNYHFPLREKTAAAHKYGEAVIELFEAAEQLDPAANQEMHDALRS